MSVTKFKVDKKEYVIISRRRYETLTRPEEDKRDSAIATKAMAEYRGGKMKTISHEQLKHELGL